MQKNEFTHENNINDMYGDYHYLMGYTLAETIWELFIGMNFESHSIYSAILIAFEYTSYNTVEIIQNAQECSFYLK